MYVLIRDIQKRNILYVNTSRSLLASRVVQLELACPPRRDNDDADSSDSRFPLHFLSDLMMAPTTAPRPSSIDASLPPNGHSAKSFFSAWLHPQSPTEATSRVFTLQVSDFQAALFDICVDKVEETCPCSIKGQLLRPRSRSHALSSACG